MMELENIVANTVYIKAKESGFDKDKGRSKKWKSILAFPHISECLYIKKTLDCSYSYIVEKQPIGKRLFWEFAKTMNSSKIFIECLDEIDNLYVCKVEDKESKLKSIIKNYFDEESQEYIKFVNMELLTKINEIISSCDLEKTELHLYFNEIQREIHCQLRTEYFNKFVDSIYFNRYLQWKYLERKKVTKDTFRMYRVLGIGGFGEVCACQVRATGKLYACKKLNKKRMKKRRGEVMGYTEKIILQRVHSCFIVSLAYAFETKDSLCLVLTIMNGGDLRFHIHNLNNGIGFSEDRARFYAVEILLGIEHLHSLNIIYRDLKPCNILIDDVGHVRISDLGLATVIEPGKTVKGRYGTLGYMAPEVLRNEAYSFSPDWFGFGCIIYEMIMGLAPFRKKKNERVKKDDFDHRVCEEQEDYNAKFSQDSKLLCQALLAKHPDSRLGCFDCQPNMGASMVKKHVWFNNVNWQRMEARLDEPPFKPDIHAVYAKDVLDIEQFSTVRGVKLTQKDENFYKKFCTGAVSIPWQQEMIETGCYEDLNQIFIPGTDRVVSNLDPDLTPPQKKAKKSILNRILSSLRRNSVGSQAKLTLEERSTAEFDNGIMKVDTSANVDEHQGDASLNRTESNYQPKIDYLSNYFEGDICPKTSVIGNNKKKKFSNCQKFLCCSTRK